MKLFLGVVLGVTGETPLFVDKLVTDPVLFIELPNFELPEVPALANPDSVDSVFC